MLFGTIKKLLSSEYKEFDDTILVESPFDETTRDGSVKLRLVLLGLSSKAFIIASEYDITGKNRTTSDGTPLCRESSIIEILSLYPWESVRLSVFKSTEKQVLKASFLNNGVRYFELRDIPKKKTSFKSDQPFRRNSVTYTGTADLGIYPWKALSSTFVTKISYLSLPLELLFQSLKIFWSLWLRSIKELQCSDKKWPFTLSTQVNTRKLETRVAECIELRFIKHTEKEKWLKWTDKYLYLGSTREEEDKVRPVPVPGLGRTEEINLYYLKPRYFGCWEQSEHWVQCGDSSLNTIITYSK